MLNMYHTVRSGKARKGMPVPSSRNLNCQMTLRHSRYAIPQSLRNFQKNAEMQSFLKLG